MRLLGKGSYISDENIKGCISNSDQKQNILKTTVSLHLIYWNTLLWFAGSTVYIEKVTFFNFSMFSNELIKTLNPRIA